MTKVKDELSFEMTSVCSKCGHHGIIIINDEGIEEEIKRQFWKVAALFSVARILLLMLASSLVAFVVGLALGFLVS